MRGIRFSMKCSCIQVRTSKGGCRSRRRNPCFRGGKRLVGLSPRSPGHMKAGLGLIYVQGRSKHSRLRVVVAYGLLRIAPAGQTPVKPRLQNTYGIFYTLNSIYSPKTFLLFAWRHSVLLFGALLLLVLHGDTEQRRGKGMFKTMTHGGLAWKKMPGRIPLPR